jgi:cation:H+ antiporter
MVLGLFTPSIFMGIVSFALLVIASWCVGEGGEILGKKYDASIIGGLVIAWLNTAPETIFFIVALTSNNPRFAVGAVSGSTIVVCTVALGACLYIGSKASKTKDFELLASIRLQCIILGISLIFPILLATFGFQIITGVLAILFYAAFLLYSLFKKKVTPDPAPIPLPTIGGDGPMVDHVKDEEAGTVAHADDEDSDSEGEVSIRKGVLFLVVGGLLITVFSEPFIGSVALTAKTLEVNPILLAFFLAPVASEMPEILESISLSRRGRARSINIAFSNLIGGTITKTSFLLGILCFYGVSREFKWESPNYPISMSLIMLCASAAAATGIFFKRLNYTNGALLWALFAFTGLMQYYFNSTFVDN